MATSAAEHIEMPLGVVVRKTPGATRWARWYWRAVAALPGAARSDWTELRREGEAVEYHAATLPLRLWASDAEAYLVNLADRVPSIYVVSRPQPGDERRMMPVLVTAAPYEAQDYAESGEDVVDKVPMSVGLIAWVRDFAQAHHRGEGFVKRRRDRLATDRIEDGKGDARIRQVSDVFRAPRRDAP